MYSMLVNIWKCREFIYSCVKREFLAKYQGSIMGIAWSVFQPLSMIIVYTVIFSNVMQSKLAGMESMAYSYSIYLCAGLLPWGFFCEILQNCSNVFLANANLMKKVSFPRICLPVITVCSAFLNFIIGFALFAAFMAIIGHFPIHSFWKFLVLLGIQTLLSVALGISLGVLNVFFRDVGQMLNIVLQFWFWFTPIIYPLNIIPAQFQWLMSLNPMYHIVKGYQSVFLYDRVDGFFGAAVVLVLGLVIGAWALHLYRQHVGELVDEL